MKKLMLTNIRKIKLSPARELEFYVLRTCRHAKGTSTNVGSKCEVTFAIQAKNEANHSKLDVDRIIKSTPC